MSKCDFLLPFSGTASELENKLKTGIESYGGNADTTAKSFSIKIPVVGTISGNYSFEEQHIRINIDSKPMLLSCDQIEKQVGQFLAG